jgi:chromosomal replication initiation ATPase DnaA
MSYPEIGKRFNKDHTTILHGVRRHAARLSLELSE